MLLTAIINQKPIQTLQKRVKWETIIKVSDYQDIINIVYLGILGMKKNISEDCELEFYQKYKKELLLYDSYHNAEEVIMWQLERHGIHALFLSDTSVKALYPKPVMVHIGQIEILVDKKNLPQIHRLMLDMDYEQKEDRLGNGIIYVRIPGIQIVFYDRVSIDNRVLRKYFSEPARKYLRMENYNFIHMLSDEEEYMYRAGKLVEHYIKGILKAREILDFWLYQKALDEKFRWKVVKDLVEKAEWQEFIHQIEVLSSLWFEEDARQQYGIALELEEFILCPGKGNMLLDEQLLPYEKARLDFYWRNRDREWRMKKREWLFPPIGYMCHFFPILEKYSFLLAFCWIVRELRFLRKIIFDKIKRAEFRIKIKLLDIKEKVKGRIGKKEKEELPDETYPMAENKDGEESGEDSEDAADAENAEGGEEPKCTADVEESGSKTENAANMNETEGDNNVKKIKDQE